MDSPGERWRSYFASTGQLEAEPARRGNPSTRSVTIDLVRVHRADGELAQAVIRSPDRLLSAARSTLWDLTEASVPIQLRVENNPHLCAVSDLSARQLDDLVTAKGVVDTAGPIRASAVSARYVCPACDASVTISPTGVERREPTRCERCEWGGGFEFDPSGSEFVDTQRLGLTPVPDERDDSHRPEPFTVYVHGDLVGEIPTDSHVGVTGVLRVRESSETPLSEPYLDALSVRDERDVSPPDTLREALDSHWEPD